MEEAVYRLFLALQRMENQVPVITALLGRWLTAEEVPSASTSAVGEVLERLIVATQVRYPVIGDIARNLRFRLFDEPQIRKAREQIYDSVREGLQYLADNPDAPDYAARIDALVATPALLIDLLAERISNPGPLLEVVTRQYYEIRALEDVKTFEQAGGQFVTGSYELAGRAAASGIDGDRSRAVVGNAATPSTQSPDPRLTTSSSTSICPGRTPPPTATNCPLSCADVLAAHPSATSWRRVTVTVVGRELHQVTFRPAPDGGLAEDLTIRDMHPLTGQRLDLWRLKNFNGTRLPAAAGTYLFHVVAKENPSDERLIALAEVRDVTPQLNEAGEVVGVPAIERTLAACLDGIRRAQAQRGKKRLDNNRVALYVWPVLDIPARPCPCDGAPHRTADDQRRAGGDHHPGEHQGRRDGAAPASGDSLLVHSGRRRRRECDGSADRAVAPARRVRTEGAALTSPRLGLPVRADPGSHRQRRQRSSNTTSTNRANLVPVDRPYGRNTAGLIVGMVTRRTPLYPEGMTRVAMFGDPTKALGTVAEAECARVVAALDLAEELSAPVEWFALVLRRHHFDGERHREHGLGVPRASPNHHVHPGRW